MEVLFICNMHANDSYKHKRKNSTDNVGLFLFIFLNGMFTDQSARCFMIFQQWKSVLIPAGKQKKVLGNECRGKFTFTLTVFLVKQR